MKLNWFSPLPPAATEIAHHTARMLAELSSLADVTLWTTKRRWPRSLEHFAEVRRYGLDQIPWVELNRADMTFYNIGNNPRFHRPIWHVSRLHAGVVILHDLRLHHFFDGIYRGQYQSLDLYLEVMARYYGEAARYDAQECFRTGGRNIDYMAQHYPLTELALENALGVIVHTRQAFDSLKAKVECPLAYARLPFPADCRTVVSRPSGPPYRLILSGYLGRNRRLDSVFKALAGLKQRGLFHLGIFGSIIEDEEHIRTELRELKLTRSVTLHGFVPEQKLEAALASAHLAINLRFPTAGEASASQLRIWSHALPSLVSQVDWYASLPPETVAFVRSDEHEVADIQRHLKRLLSVPADFVSMGQNGLAHLKKHHAPETYCRSLVAIVEQARPFRSRAAVRSLIKRAAAPISDWLPPEALKEALQHVVKESFDLVKR